MLHQDRREGVQRTGRIWTQKTARPGPAWTHLPTSSLEPYSAARSSSLMASGISRTPAQGPEFPQATLVQTPPTTDHTPQKANPKDSPSRHWPLKKTFCSSRNFSSFSEEEKFSSRDTALHFRIFFGTRAGGQEKEEKRRFPISSSH